MVLSKRNAAALAALLALMPTMFTPAEAAAQSPQCSDQLVGHLSARVDAAAVSVSRAFAAADAKRLTPALGRLSVLENELSLACPGAFEGTTYLGRVERAGSQGGLGLGVFMVQLARFGVSMDVRSILRPSQGQWSL